MNFVKANREKVNIKISLMGPTGSGKPFSSLRLTKDTTEKPKIKNK